MNVIFQVDGGLGKSIMATAMVKVIRNNYPSSKIIVVTAYPDVFLHNPIVSETYNINQINGLYLKHIKGQDWLVLTQEPYRQSDFILEKPISLYETWCDSMGLTYSGENPSIYLSLPEIDYYGPFYKTDKPILTIQPHGGPITQGYQYSWTRDIPTPIVNQIIEHYKEDYTIIHVKHEKQVTYENTLQALDNFRSIAILLSLSNKRLLIDSSSQHIAAALSLRSTVCWSLTKPEVFGYDIHDNIKAEPFTLEPSLEQATYSPWSLSQEISTIPYRDLYEVFNTDKIINSINNQ